MCFFFSFIPATFWVVVGYFVLFASTKAEGGIRTFGKALAIWTFVIAALVPAMGLYVTVGSAALPFTCLSRPGQGNVARPPIHEPSYSIAAVYE